MLYNWRSALLSTEEVGRVMIEEFFNYYTLLIVDLNQSQLTTTATTIIFAPIPVAKLPTNPFS